MERHRTIATGSGTVTMRAFGVTRYELFENMAEAMFSVGRDQPSIAPTHSRPLVAPGDTYTELLHNWLDELIFLGDQHDIAFSQATVDRLETGGVQGSASGMYRSEVRVLGPQVQRVGDIGELVEIPEGWWVDVAFGVPRGLRLA